MLGLGLAHRSCLFREWTDITNLEAFKITTEGLHRSSIPEITTCPFPIILQFKYLRRSLLKSLYQLRIYILLVTCVSYALGDCSSKIKGSI
ncbi:hypothetical protein H9L39_01241 [Fusarium oxysporum f. sp. albedinis]|nr:hypothetical protein H9L39_01241 [Fusarium oxysporum f. sp. albedinis]